MAHLGSTLWSDSGTWIALGATAVSVLVGVAMSVVFRRILRQPLPGAPGAHNTPQHKPLQNPKDAPTHE